MLRRFRLPLLAAAAIAAGAPSGCAVSERGPDLQKLYFDASRIDGARRRPLIAVPGILGSRLRDRESGLYVWGGGDALTLDPGEPENLRLVALPFFEGDRPGPGWGDGVVAETVLDTAVAKVLGVPVEVEVYRGILDMLQAGGWLLTAGAIPPPNADRPATIEFAYDWRRDIPLAAQELHETVMAAVAAEKERRRARGEDDGKPVRVDIIAHSMGALITRYYLMYGPREMPESGRLPKVTWAGAKNVARVVLVAPPNAGSPLAFDHLVNGKDLGALQPRYPAAVVGAHPTVYQLMPRNRHQRVVWADDGSPVEDLYDPELWRRMGWGLADPREAANIAALSPELPAEEARARALKFQAWALRRAKRLHEMLDREAPEPPEELDIYLVVGGGYETPARVSVDRDSGRVQVVDREEGDGVVLRASALLDERQEGEFGFGLETPLHYDSVLFLPDEHVGLTASPVFGDNLLFWLLEGKRTGDGLRPTARVVEERRREARRLKPAPRREVRPIQAEWGRD